MSSPNLQLENGQFSDAEGNVLALGYLLLELSHDENYASGPAQICAGIKFQINLNSSGSIPTSPAVMVYSNDVLTPSGSYYIVRAFKADGTEAWSSPQTWNLSSSPNPLDVGTIVPSSPPGTGLSGAGALTLLLQTNDVNNANQALLDFKDTATVTWANSGGQMRATASGGPSFTTAGQGYFFGPGIMEPIQAISRASGASWVAAANTVYVVQFDLLATFNVTKISINVTGNAIGKHGGFGIYNAAGTTKLVDSGAMSLGSIAVVTSTITTVALSPGTYFWAQTSDGTTATINTTSSISTGEAALFNANASFPRIATAANASAAGVLPATLGALTAVTAPTIFDTALVMLEP